MFFKFKQNYCGCSFISTETIGTSTIIESQDLEEAIEIAEKIGLYFDGFKKGVDCCSDRFSKDAEIIEDFKKADIIFLEEQNWDVENSIVIHKLNGEKQYAKNKSWCDF